MPVNTTALDDGQYTTLSSVSGTASRSTAKFQDLVATSTLSAPATTLTGALTGTGATFSSAVTAQGWLYAGVFISSATTAQSGATSKVSQQGQFYFSVLSLTSNGGEIGFRSGNTVYRFASVAVG